MSFLSELVKKKDKLKVTDTVVTKIDGQRYVERGGDAKNVEKLTPCYGFVVDTKPDNVPVLVIDNLYIGSQDCASDSVIDVNNIKHVLSLGVNVYVNVNHKYIDCLDLPETDIKCVLREGIPFIKEAVDKKENILIHCNAGVSRTSMMAIGYLMHCENMQFEDAYILVKEKRPAVQPNDGFRKQLMALNPGQVI
ncbi:dual specificity protein phosphatase 19 [Galleria mellonella]|uniref:Dual specificity protein phosphatase 19 n=1 Tax=Galleria mellonella TaxID=7137 RepID=A0A6J1WH02_GALME|nr:dual specificity protein phosphatase 19 [Galleria mellonella]